MTKQAVLNRIPLRAAGRIVTDGHAQAQAVAELALQWRFPQPGTTAITAPSVCQDQEVPGLGVHQAPTVPHQCAIAVTANSDVSAEAPT